MHPLLASGRALVPVFNPHDADRGYSSTHLVPSAGPASATTNTAVASVPAESTSFWHPVGTVVSGVLDYYMGNDPCRTVDRTRRRLAGGDAECIGTDDTLEGGQDQEEELVGRSELLSPLNEALLSRIRAAEGFTESEGVFTARALSRDRATQDPQAGLTKPDVSGPKTTVEPGEGAPPSTPKPTKRQPLTTSTTGQEWTIYGVGGVLLLALMAMALR